MADDPRQAVLECLAEKPRHPPRVVKQAARSGGARFLLRSSFGADPARVVFLKERGADRRRLYAVDFEDQDRKAWHWLVAVEQNSDTDGWNARLVAGGGGRWGENDPWHAREPRINLAGGWNADGYYGGGAVHPAGAGIEFVRLTFANAVTLEDDAVGNLALFLTDRAVEMPVTVEFIDSSGRLISQREEHRANAELRATMDELQQRGLL